MPPLFPSLLSSFVIFLPQQQRANILPTLLQHCLLGCPAGTSNPLPSPPPSTLSPTLLLRFLPLQAVKKNGKISVSISHARAWVQKTTASSFCHPACLSARLCSFQMPPDRCLISAQSTTRRCLSFVSFFWCTLQRAPSLPLLATHYIHTGTFNSGMHACVFIRSIFHTSAHPSVRPSVSTFVCVQPLHACRVRAFMRAFTQACSLRSLVHTRLSIHSGIPGSIHSFVRPPPECMR